MKNLVFGAVLAVLPLFAGCGGGGDDSGSANNDNSPGINPVACILVFLATGGQACAPSSSSSTPTSSAASSSLASLEPSSSKSKSAGPGPLLRQNEEFAFNGDLGSANLPLYAVRTSTDQEIGWLVTGSIDGVNDITDAFAFTPLQTREYVLALCPPDGSACDSNNGIDTLTAFFRLLDQDGNVLLTSQADIVDGNSHRITLDAGVLYYLTVDAGDTMGVAVDYRLFAYEAA
jgi:hypothetical protein